VKVVEVEVEMEMEVVLVEAAMEAFDCKMSKPCNLSNHTWSTIQLVFVHTTLCTLRKMSNPYNVAKHTFLSNRSALLHTTLRTAHLLHSHVSSFAEVWMSRTRIYK
jgi:hypothetical protein